MKNNLKQHDVIRIMSCYNIIQYDFNVNKKKYNFQFFIAANENQIFSNNNQQIILLF